MEVDTVALIKTVSDACIASRQQELLASKNKLDSVMKLIEALGMGIAASIPIILEMTKADRVSEDKYRMDKMTLDRERVASVSSENAAARAHDLDMQRMKMQTAEKASGKHS